MGKWKPYLVTAVVSIIAFEVYTRFIRPKLFKA